MSGFSSFSAGSGTPPIFADISARKGGIFIRGRDGEADQLHGRYQGAAVTKIDWKDNGKAGKDLITNLRVHAVTATGDKAILSVALGTFHAGKVAGLFNAIDLNKPFDLRVTAAKEGDVIGTSTMAKDTTFVTMWQDGVKLKPVYSNGTDKLPDAPVVTLPNGQPVMVNGQPVKDMTAVNAEVAAVINVLMAKSDALHEQDSVPAEDDGIDAHQVMAAEAASQAAAPRATMGQRG